MIAHKSLNATLISVFNDKDIPYEVVGSQINADIDGTGHKSYKITPHKGVYYNAATGKGGMISWLLRKILKGEIKVNVSNPPPQDENEKRMRQFAVSKWRNGFRFSGKEHTPNLASPIAIAARDTAHKYLVSRLGEKYADHWLNQVRLEAGPDGQVVMLLPMLDGAMDVCGVQRTFLDACGNKINRKMLGKKGWTILKPPAGIECYKIYGEGGQVVVGEGFETVASVVQESGAIGICAHDAGGLRKVAEAIVMSKNPDAPYSYIFLADRDVSETGIKASTEAVNILRSHGFTATAALPMTTDRGGPVGGEKGSDWNDYTKERLAHAIVPHLQIAASEFELLSRHVKVATDFVAWKESDQPAPEIVTAPVNEVRHKLLGDVVDVVGNYMEWVSKPKKGRGKFAPALFEVTPGVGKSQIIKELPGLYKNDPFLRVAVGVQTHEQADEYEANGYFHFYGRKPESAGIQEATCYAYEDVEKIQATNHFAQPDLCVKCPYGFKWALEDAKSKIEAGCDDYEAQMARYRNSITKLVDMGIDHSTIKPCRWQQHLRDAVEAQFLVLTHGSYSHSLVGDALYFTDEAFDASKKLAVTLEDLSGWAERIRELVRSADDELKEKLEDAAQFVAELSRQLCEWAGAGKTGSVEIDHDLVAAIKALLEIVGRAETAPWERLGFNTDGSLRDNPLRAAADLAGALGVTETAYVERGVLRVTAILPIVERICKGLPTAFMDATASQLIKDVVMSNGGTVYRNVATQNLKAARYPQRFMGLTPLSEERVGEERVGSEIDDVYRRMIFDLFPDDAFIIHKRAWDQLTDDEKKRPGLGYWGKDHRAQNWMTGMNLNIVGSFYPPQAAWREMYLADRFVALSAGCDKEAWPAWPDDMEMEEGVWVDEGGTLVQSRMPLPSDLRIRDWLLRRITAETVQAIGRARGANSDHTIEVRIFGGVPLVGLHEYGIKVDSYESNPPELGGRSVQQANHDRHVESVYRLNGAAARIVADGGKITRGAMAAEIGEMEEDHLYELGEVIYTKPVQKDLSGGAYRQWLEYIKEAAPALFESMERRGRGAKVVGIMVQASKALGHTAARIAVHAVETVLKGGEECVNGYYERISSVELDDLGMVVKSVVSILTGCCEDQEPHKRE